MPAQPQYKAVLFDMDGLLLDTERVVNQALIDTAAFHGMTDLEETFLAMIGFRGAESEAILREGLAGRVDLDHFCADAETRIVEFMQRGVPLKNRVLDLLGAIDTLKLPCAVASSTETERVEQHLHEAGIRPYFSVIVGGDQVVEGKPSPEIYLKAASAIGVDPAHCIAFEDSEPGTLAAIAAGITVVQVPDLIPPSDSLRARGHIIADDIWKGAIAAGLCV